MRRLFCGIDVGTRSSSFCVVDKSRKILKRWSGATSEIAAELSKIKSEIICVIEAGPLSEHICEQVEKVGKKIELIDSRHTKSILHGRKKTDRIDAKVLADLAAMGWYNPIYRKHGEARQMRTVLQGRATIVKATTQLKNSIRGLLKANGIVLPAKLEGLRFSQRVLKEISSLNNNVRQIIADMLEVWQMAYEKQRREYNHIAKLAAGDVVARRLMTVPGVGPATALCFAATITTHQRFANGEKVSSYVGLAPRVHQSGDTNYTGKITKQGDKLMRWLLIEAASCMLTRVKESFPLRDWALEMQERKGSAKTKVALARKLSMLLYTLWRTESDFKIPHNQVVAA